MVLRQRVLAPGAGMMVAEVDRRRSTRWRPVSRTSSASTRRARDTQRCRRTSAMQYRPLQRRRHVADYAAALVGGSLGVGSVLPDARRDRGQSAGRHRDPPRRERDDRPRRRQARHRPGRALRRGRAGGNRRPPGRASSQHDVVVQVRFLDRSDDLALFVRMTRGRRAARGIRRPVLTIRAAGGP